MENKEGENVIDHEKSVIAQIDELEKQIAELPAGYISKKIIRGKLRNYLQWTENGKIKSKYIRDDELPEFQEKIEKRHKLQSDLKNLKKTIPAKTNHTSMFDTNTVMGAPLNAMTQEVITWERRDCFEIGRAHV